MTISARILASLAMLALLTAPVGAQTPPGTTVAIDEVSREGDTLTVSGGSGYVDQPFLTLGTDPAGDINPALAAAGMDVTGASMATTLSGAVRLRWSVASLPPGVQGAPGVIYSWTFCVESGDCFELDLSRVNGNPPSADPYAYLWRCAAPDCSPGGQTVAQNGGMPVVFDTGSNTVTVTLPGLISAAPGRTISPVNLDANGPVFTMAGTLSPWTGQYNSGDGVSSVADYVVPRRQVSVVVGAPGLDPAMLDYQTTVLPAANGSWTASLDVAGAPEEFAVYARACFGPNNCGYASTAAPVLVEPAYGGLNSAIRPGNQLGSSCTFNFIFHQEVYAMPGEPAPTPEVYIGTAQHCTSSIGQRLSTSGVGQFATVVYRNSTVDFALARIDADKVGQVNPQMRGFPGPKGVATPSMLAVGDLVHVYGYGVVVGQAEQTRGRSGVLTEWNQNEYMADMPAVNGDSGAPILHDETGYALGVISRYGIRVPPSTDIGPLVDWALRELHKDAAFSNVVLSTV